MAEHIVVKVAVGVEPVRMRPPRIGLAFAQDLTSCTDFERVEVEAEAETSLQAGECSWTQKMIQDLSEAGEGAERVGEVEQEAGVSPLVVATVK